jgi:iron(III) transport system permease protein
MMAEQNHRISAPRLPVWTLAALAVAGLVLMPVVSVVWLALTPQENIWPHLQATVLPRYLSATALLMAGVAVLAAAMGTGAAWLVVVYRFPGRGWLDHALLVPLAVPAYVGAYALVDLTDYAGALQTGLRAAFGWESARDYWFPAVRSLPFCALVLAAALYPYVYLLARSAFREQSGSAYDVARALGTGPWGLFWRLGLPLARPALAVGVALALMEVAADYGTVAHFGVQTLTTGIFSVWVQTGNPGGAAQLSLVLLGFIALLMVLERAGRRRARFHRLARGDRPVVPQALHGWRGWLAAGACALPFGLGFVLPVGVMAHHALGNPGGWRAAGLLAALGNSVAVAGVAAALAVGLALVLVYGLRLGRGAAALLPLTALGYAAPGAVLALGLLVPLAALDHRLADAVEVVTGADPGLLLTGSAAALVLAYVLRFFAIAQGAVDAALGRVSPSLPLAARSLGQGAGGTLRAVYLPLMRGSVLSALLIVFVDCVKELPATLLLRPFNFETLATRAYEQASLERLHDAAPAALLVIALGLCAVAALARANRG